MLRIVKHTAIVRILGCSTVDFVDSLHFVLTLPVVPKRQGDTSGIVIEFSDWGGKSWTTDSREQFEFAKA